jgi:hypothetical protein
MLNNSITRHLMALLLLVSYAAALSVPFARGNAPHAKLDIYEKPKHYRQLHVKRQFVNVNISSSDVLARSTPTVADTTSLSPSRVIETTIDSAMLSSILEPTSSALSQKTSSVEHTSLSPDASTAVKSSAVTTVPEHTLFSRSQTASSSDILSEINSAFSGLLSSISGKFYFFFILLSTIISAFY